MALSVSPLRTAARHACKFLSYSIFAKVLRQFSATTSNVDAEEVPTASERASISFFSSIEVKTIYKTVKINTMDTDVKILKKRIFLTMLPLFFI